MGSSCITRTHISSRVPSERANELETLLGISLSPLLLLSLSLDLYHLGEFYSFTSGVIVGAAAAPDAGNYSQI